MKKTILMAAVLGAMGFANVASANVATNVFTWSGSVPTSATQNGFIIKAADQSDIQNGILVFTADAAGKGNLQSATTLDFNVFDYTGNVVGTAATQYTYQLTNLAATNGGLVQEQDASGYYAITADSVEMVKGTAVSKATGGQTVLTVVPSSVATPSNQPNTGDDVAVQATIMVTAATM